MISPRQTEFSDVLSESIVCASADVQFIHTILNENYFASFVLLFPHMNVRFVSRWTPRFRLLFFKSVSTRRGVTTQKTNMNVFIAVRTSGLTQLIKVILRLYCTVFQLGWMCLCKVVSRDGGVSSSVSAIVIQSGHTTGDMWEGRGSTVCNKTLFPKAKLRPIVHILDKKSLLFPSKEQ